jgi:hypothetical protein
VGNILLSMFPGSLTVCQTNPDGSDTTHTHFSGDAWIDPIGEDDLICLGLRWYNSFLPPIRDYHADP